MHYRTSRKRPKEVASLINMVNKGEIDAAASGLGLDTNLALSLYSTLHALSRFQLHLFLAPALPRYRYVVYTHSIN